MKAINSLQLETQKQGNGVVSHTNEVLFQLRNLAIVFGLDEQTNKLLENIEPKNQENFIKNIKTLIFLYSRRGKTVKNLSSKSKGHTAIHINNLLNEGIEFIENIKQGKNIIPNILERENKSLTALLTNPNKVYEKLLLEIKYKQKSNDRISAIQEGKETNLEDQMFQTINQEIKRRNISGKSFGKWINLIDITFKEKPEQMIDLFLDNFGFLPEELYTKLAFNNLGFDSIADFHEILRKKEKQLKKSKGNYIKISQIRNIRAIFLKYMFLSKKGKKNKTITGICESANNQSMLQVTPDINGVWIKIFKGKKSIVSHIPYSYADDNLIDYWKENQWINENDYLEIKKQKSLELGDKHKANKLEFQQIDNIFALLSNKKDSSSEEKIALIAENILENPNKVGKILSDNRLSITSSIIQYILQISNLDKKEVLYKLFILAESITSCMSHEVLFDRKEMSYSYELAYRTRNARQKRMKYLNNDPRYYNILIIIQEILGQGVPENDIEKGFMMFSGNYSSREQSQLFIEIMHENKSSRILIGEKKHVPKSLRKSIEEIPSLDQTNFENLELLVKSTGLAKESIGIVKQDLVNLVESKENLHKLFENMIGRIQDISVFILNYLPHQYKKFMHIVDKLNGLSSIKNEDIEKFKLLIENFVILIENSLVEIQNNISEYAHKGEEENHIDFQIQTSELKFNKDFLRKIKSAELKDYQYSEVLAISGSSIKIAHIDTLETNSVNYMAESKAINELQLKEKKPLIIVSGGCKQASEEGLKTFNKLNEIIIKIGDKKKANISIPCTQSGIGNSLSEGYINYQDLTVGIDESKKMRMFAIAPALTMFTDEGKDNGNVYAPSTVDQIFLPCSADWDIKDEKILKAGYFQFIAGAESIYNRLDKNKKRVHIVGNGGLFTIAEVNEAMKNKAQIVLIKGSGRFADIASIGIEHIGELYSLLSMRTELKTIGDYHNYYYEIKQLIGKYTNEEDYQEWLSKDWGEDIEIKETTKNQPINSFEEYFQAIGNQEGITHKHILYRQYFETFFNLSLNSYNLPIISDIDKLEENLTNLI